MSRESITIDDIVDSQTLVELVDDTITTFRAEIKSGAMPFEDLVDVLRRALLAAYMIGARDGRAEAQDEGEEIAQAIDEVAGRRFMQSADMMAWLMLLNEYGNQSVDIDQSKLPAHVPLPAKPIFTTMNIRKLAADLDAYDCSKFHLENGQVEYQIRKR